MVTKTCKKCVELLPIERFNKNRLSKDGLRSDCKECQGDYNKEHRQVCREHYKTFDKERAKTPERVEELAIARDLHRERHPVKYKARCAVNNAIRDGRLTRPEECSVCCKECIPDGHHHSYEKEFWLDVTWVCRDCHIKLHNEEENHGD